MSENYAIYSLVSSIRNEFNVNIDKAADISYLIEKLQIRLKEVHLSDGVLGSCKSVGRKRLITVDPGIKYCNQKRFVIAHEIGHLLLHQNSYICKRDAFEMWRSKSSFEIEQEANSFAAELLLPSKKVIELLSKNDLTMSFLEQLSSLYEASLTASAIAAINVFRDKAILICHKSREKIWSYNSSECYFSANKNIPDTGGSGITKAEAWISTDDDTISCEYETKGFSNAGYSLTIVKIFQDN